jgi:coenzyme F420-reducing hydrogenase delta subunit
MVNMSSAMAVQFAEEVKDMTEKIQALGPNPLREAPSSEQQSDWRTE